MERLMGSPSSNVDSWRLHIRNRTLPPRRTTSRTGPFRNAEPVRPCLRYRLLRAGGPFPRLHLDGQDGERVVLRLRALDGSRAALAEQGLLEQFAERRIQGQLVLA